MPPEADHDVGVVVVAASFFFFFFFFFLAFVAPCFSFSSRWWAMGVVVVAVCACVGMCMCMVDLFLINACPLVAWLGYRGVRGSSCRICMRTSKGRLLLLVPAGVGRSLLVRGRGAEMERGRRMAKGRSSLEGEQQGLAFFQGRCCCVCEGGGGGRWLRCLFLLCLLLNRTLLAFNC